MLFRRNDTSLTVFAPAKLNLFLELLGKRDDGFHELETLMVSVDVYDTLIFSEDTADRITLQVESGGSEVPQDGTNLVLQAARILQAHASVDRGVRIVLRKRIPVAAGLAGGSSDAAATLVGLNQFWKCGLKTPELCELAARLGSDIAYFVRQEPLAVCRGRGEIVQPVAAPLGWHFVIAKPDSGLSTADVYRHSHIPDAPRDVDRLVESLSETDGRDAVSLMHNALQTPAEELNEDVDAMRKRFEHLSVLGHMMSGSGTAYFGVCASHRHAVHNAGRLRMQGVSQVFIARSLA